MQKLARPLTAFPKESTRAGWLAADVSFRGENLERWDKRAKR